MKTQDRLLLSERKITKVGPKCFEIDNIKTKILESVASVCLPQKMRNGLSKSRAQEIMSSTKLEVKDALQGCGNMTASGVEKDLQDGRIAKSIGQKFERAFFGDLSTTITNCETLEEIIRSLVIELTCSKKCFNGMVFSLENLVLGLAEREITA